MNDFKASEIGEKFITYRKEFDDIANQNSKVLNDVKTNLDKELEDFKKRGFLTVSFIGEYSAGKSTIISALTGRRDIKISADIATDRTSTYDWNGIKIIDTPGLYTHRKDHDDITYEAIRQSDLLVFCLTHSLFDSITIENFRKLAYDENYRHKMMLVVNKMSAEAGNEDQKIRSYKESISVSLRPYNFEEFPISFIDALDFIDGTDEKDEELKEISRFDTFITILNNFVKNRSVLAKLETPIHILFSHLNDATERLSRGTVEDNAYIELLNRMTKSIEREKSSLKNKVHNTTFHLSSKVSELGRTISNKVGGEENIEGLCKEAEAKIHVLCEKSSKEIESIINDSIRSAEEQISEIYNSKLAQSFYGRINALEKVDRPSLQQSSSMKNLKEQYTTLTNIIGNKPEIIKQAATGSSGASGIFLKASDAAGSSLHQGILSVGKFFGFSFKPWQAVNLAKSIGNIMGVVGPLLIVGSFVVEVVSAQQEAENERKLAEARREINSQFHTIGENLENQFEIKLREVEKEIYGPVEDKIFNARIIEEKTIAQSNKDVQKVLNIRQKLNGLLNEISL